VKIRLDELLVARGLAPDLTRSRAYILAGRVTIKGQRADKAGSLFPADCQIDFKKERSPYVSRGGVKLAAGLDNFKVKVKGLTCMDVGASSGGFTDCLLKRGARRVYAVDVGYGQLDWSLRQDPRVVVMERTNARKLTTKEIPEALDLAVIDASFISLKNIIPPLLPLFGSKTAIVALIKPQFEARRDQVGAGGVVRDQLLQGEIIKEVAAFAADIGLTQPLPVCPSPILGPKGNQEYLIYLVN